MPIIFRTTPVSEPFTLESVGEQWEQDHVTRPGGYPFYHYLQTESGTGQVDTTAGSFLLHENEGILIAPFIRHSYRSSEGPWLTKFATFNGTAERSIPQIMGNRQVIRVGSAQGKVISGLISDCVRIYGSHPLDSRQLSIKCYAILLNIADSTSAAGPADEPLYRKYVLPVIEEIERDYALPLTVDEMSRNVFITPQYLSRLFRRYLNCSAYEYLTSYRISKAKELLITSPLLDIQDIALKTGFSDPSHFISIFRKAVGTTPLKFRKFN